MRFPDPDKPYAEQDDTVLAALTCYGEARGESVAGKRGVLWVIRNRRDKARAKVAKSGRPHPLFGDGTVAGVVLKKWQFSCWNKGDPNLALLSKAVETGGTSIEAWEAFYMLAESVLANEGATADPTFGATHYCTTALWNAKDSLAWYGEPEIAAGRTVETRTIGNHVFARAS